MEQVVFRRFSDMPAAAELAGWLQAKGLDATLVDTGRDFHPAYIRSVLTQDFRVVLPQAQVEAAEKLLQEFYSRYLHRLPADYYLFGFTEEELIRVVRHPQEWGELDVILAQRLLHDRLGL